MEAETEENFNLNLLLIFSCFSFTSRAPTPKDTHRPSTLTSSAVQQTILIMNDFTAAGEIIFKFLMENIIFDFFLREERFIIMLMLLLFI